MIYPSKADNPLAERHISRMKKVDERKYESYKLNNYNRIILSF